MKCSFISLCCPFVKIQIFQSTLHCKTFFCLFTFQTQVPRSLQYLCSVGIVTNGLWIKRCRCQNLLRLDQRINLVPLNNALYHGKPCNSWQLNFEEPTEREVEIDAKSHTSGNGELQTVRKGEVGIPRPNCIVFETPEYPNK